VYLVEEAKEGNNSGFFGRPAGWLPGDLLASNFDLYSELRAGALRVIQVFREGLLDEGKCGMAVP
jgi:hypothetical protein